jgi:hypothetical protein
LKVRSTSIGTKTPNLVNIAFTITNQSL